MKKGVASPAKGTVLLSVVFPRKVWSSMEGGAGFGEKREDWREKREWERKSRLRALSFEGLISVSLAGKVPFWKRISRRKLGWSGSFGNRAACCSLGTAHDHMVAG